MFDVKLHNQRVLCVRAGVLESVKEVGDLGAGLRAALQKTTRQVVATADFRGGTLYRPDVFEAMLATLKSDNPRVERSAFVFGRSAVLNLQVGRLVREAANPSRQVLRTVEDAMRFLSPLLTAGESLWLQQWYDAGPIAPD